LTPISSSSSSRAAPGTNFATNAQIQIARTVLAEAHYFENEHGERVDFDLNVYVAAGTTALVSVPSTSKNIRIRQFIDANRKVFKAASARVGLSNRVGTMITGNCGGGD